MNNKQPTPAESSTSEKPDYRDAAFRGALMRDSWMIDDDLYLSTVPSDLIGDVSRAGDALRTIGRLMHNSLCEPEATGAEPLGLSAHLGLMNAAELIGHRLADIADHMRDIAQGYAAFEKKQEANHG